MNEVDTERAMRHLTQGQNAAAADDLDTALAQYRTALSHDPGNWRIHEAIGHVEERASQIEAAILAVRRALAIAPASAFLHHQLGRRLAKAGAFDEAITAQRRAIELHGGVARFHLALSDALSRARQDAAAVEVAEAAAARFSDDADMAFYLASCLAEANRFEAAEQALRAAVRLELSQLELESGQGALDFGSGEAVLQALQSGPMRQTQSRLQRAMAWFSANALAEDATGLLPAAVDQAPVRIAAGMTRGPVLSIVVPAYAPTDPEWLRQAIESALCQTRELGRTELIVLDDASPGPAVAQVAAGFGTEVTYKRNDASLGLVGNHNACLSEARGEFVHVLHQDDRVEPGFYRALLDPLRRDPSLVAAFTGVRLVNAAGGLEYVEPMQWARAGVAMDLARRLLRRQRVQMASMVVRRSAYCRTGGFAPAHPFCFDWAKWAQLAAQGPVWCDPRPLAEHRVHKDSATHTFDGTERLADCLHTQTEGLARLPVAARGDAARVIYFYQFLGYWVQHMPPKGKQLAGAARFLPFR